MQLKIFDEDIYIVSYWHYEFDNNGTYIKTHLTKFTEIIEDYRLIEFISMLKLTCCKNIKTEKAVQN